MPKRKLPTESERTPKFNTNHEKLVDYQLFSPTDFRYGVKELVPYLSEEAYVKYKASIEAALANQFARRGICSKKISTEISEASSRITPAEVYAEEARIKHDIRALANVISAHVSDDAKPFVHLAATSYDIVDTANALRFRDALQNVILPDLLDLEKYLIEIALAYSENVQIGRTHGQHAEPITFGFFVANYVSRLGKRILKIKEGAKNLTGKFAGAVGAYGPLSLIVDDPEQFESELMDSIGLKKSEISTQIVQPEPGIDMMHALVSTLGVLANFARDIRNLQRTEISEVSESFGEEQVGSSTMPHKRNPITFENIESLWKKFMPQMITIYLDQVSEHQRDLTNSASQRYLPELIVAFDYAVRRMSRAIWDLKRNKPRLIINRANLLRNLRSSLDNIAAEPLYILLAVQGHPRAHEAVRLMVQESLNGRSSFRQRIAAEKSIQRYLSKMNPEKRAILENPEKYVGISSQKVRKVAQHWKDELFQNY